MGLLDFFRRLFFSSPASRNASGTAVAVESPPRARPRIVPLRRDENLEVGVHRHNGARTAKQVKAAQPPYRFARYGVDFSGFLDLSGDGDSARLSEFQLPEFRTPDELAEWLEMPVGKVAWLIHRFTPTMRPESTADAHYHYHWLRKRHKGYRLIEAPKSILKAAQFQILDDILEQIPLHPSAHGFCVGRSILTNATPHVGQAVVVKFDLENFYPSVTFARVVAIFRSVGYSREAAIWLGRLTTSALPGNMAFPGGDPDAVLPYLRRHLPQGAPTSPALANLSAFSLDLRLSGLARSFGANYTRYADDLTFSGPEPFIGSLRTFIPLVKQITTSERFRCHPSKRKILRNSQRQIVTGVVVNERTNVSRRQYDRLKAILHNCRKYGGASQNRDGHENFASHMRGHIAHVAHLNPERGQKLLALYDQITW